MGGDARETLLGHELEVLEARRGEAREEALHALAVGAVVREERRHAAEERERAAAPVVLLVRAQLLERVRERRVPAHAALVEAPLAHVLRAGACACA